jgi:splicing factor 3B subunit 3
MKQINNFYVGEMITCMQKVSLNGTTSQVIVYGTSMGSIGVLFPFETKEVPQPFLTFQDIDFFIHLEMYLRIQVLPLCGRDHLMFRSFFGPTRAVVDGDLCEQFTQLPYSKQKILAAELEYSPDEVLKKLEDLRNKII